MTDGVSGGGGGGHSSHGDPFPRAPTQQASSLPLQYRNLNARLN